jgi:hypothetical protein
MSAVHQEVQPRRVRYGTTATVLVEQEPSGWSSAAFPDYADERPREMVRRSRPNKDSSGQLIRSFILSTGLVMAFEPADQATASAETFTSATPQSLPKADLADLLRKMTPEKRALFERITALREKIGPVNFDVVQALRELREDGR